MIHLVLVMLAGLAVNGYNAEKAGHGVHSAADLKVAVEKSIDTRQAVYKVND